MERAFPVFDLGDGAGHGRAVDMHVEDIQEDADAFPAGTFGLNRHYLAIGRRNGDGPGGNGALGIAEEIETEQCEQPEDRGQPRPCEPADNAARGRQTERIVNTIFNDH